MIKTWGERMPTRLPESVNANVIVTLDCMSAEIAELRARCAELKQANSDLASTSIIREGWQLVPIEPTEKMLVGMNTVMELAYNPANAK